GVAGDLADIADGDEGGQEALLPEGEAEELFGRLLRLGRHHIQGSVAQVQHTGDVLVRVVDEAPQPRLEVVHGDRGVYADSGAHRSWAPCSSGDSSRARSDTTKSGASSACHRSAIRP